MKAQDRETVWMSDHVPTLAGQCDGRDCACPSCLCTTGCVNFNHLIMRRRSDNA